MPAIDGDIVGLHLPSRGQLIAQSFAKGFHMFLLVSFENLQKIMHIWDQFALASSSEYCNSSHKNSYYDYCISIEKRHLGLRGGRYN